ncbi:MAG: hypothetical protein RSB70_02625 [Clostridium sp.]
MNNVFKILKVNFINSIRINGFSKDNDSSKAKNKYLKSVGIIIIGCVGIILATYLYATAIAEALISIGAIGVLPIVSAIVATIAVFMTAVYKAPGSLFSSKDYDMLMSLPIDTKAILASKMLSLLSLSLGISASILLPTTMAYYQNVQISPMCFLYAVIGTILIPIIPTILASLIAFALSYISSKVKFSNMISLISMFIVTMGIFVASTKMQDIMGYFQAKSTEIQGMFTSMYPPAGWYGEIINNGSITALVKLLLVSLIPFTVFLVVLGKSFKKINSRLGENYKESNYKFKSIRTESIVKALVRKEIKRYTTCTIYIFNTGFGALLLIVGSIASIFMNSETKVAMLGQYGSFDMINLILIAGFSLLVGTITTTASSVSLEGRNLWILKSLPVNVMDIFKSKIMVTVLIAIPTVVISAIAMKISLNISVIELMWLILIPSLFAIVTAIFGLLVNLYNPKFDWTQEVKVVKQSFSVMIATFSGFGMVGAAVGAYSLLSIKNTNLFLVGILVITIAVIIILWKLLKTKGVEIFKSL